MASSSTFQRRRQKVADVEQAASSSRASMKRIENREAYMSRLWQWAANANAKRCRLTDITLVHILSGDTVSPISLSDFEAFLAFCDISLENLQFIVWFQDYRARFDALLEEQKARAPSLQTSKIKPTSGDSYAKTTSVSVPPPSTSQFHENSIEDRKASVDSSSSSDYRTSEAHSRALDRLLAASRMPPSLNISKSAYTSLYAPLSPLPWQPQTKKGVPVAIGGPNSSYSEGHGFSSSSSVGETSLQQKSAHSSHANLLFSTYPPEQSGPVYPDAQPFREEIENILATFFVPGAKKELSLTSEMRDAVIKETSKTTHPDVFFPVYESIFESTETVSLPRFLAHASTNINRPRQLFWYFSALPVFLLGLAIALLVIISPSNRLIVPPQSHRAWRLISVPCFFLASLMWYKGFRGFCPILFLRSSRQLRAWELEPMSDDNEAQKYCISIAKETNVKLEDSQNFPLTPISPGSGSSPLSHIAPFLEGGYTIKEEENAQNQDAQSDLSSMNAGLSVRQARLNEQFRSRARNGFHRPPIFGPACVVEDSRIRAVHLHLLWSLLGFGFFWAVVSAVIVVSVPSLH